MEPRPSGTVTFLFTDVVGSTALWESDPAGMAVSLNEHDQILRAAIDLNEGYVFATGGDSFSAAFSRPEQAIRAAFGAQLELGSKEWPGPEIKVRMGVHTGTSVERDGDYFGPAVARASRIMSIGHGKQILVSSATAELVPDLRHQKFELIDKGRHRLKGVTDPLQLFALVHPQLPDVPYRVLSDWQPPSEALPVPATTFVGRDQEIEEISKLVRGARLTSVLGPGGIGKTRLALRVTEDLSQEFAHGARFVPLAGLRDASLIPETVSNALGASELVRSGPYEALETYLKNKEVLAVLDNCEHLVESLAGLVDHLLSISPGLRVLVTSRRPLVLPGEVTYILAPLDADLAGVQLFMERAESARPGFRVDSDVATIRQICRRLDGLPLAIELAAARIRLLPVQEIFARLDSRFELLAGGSRVGSGHHETLKAALDWSHDLLSDREKAGFRRLSVFQGGFSSAGAEALLADLESPLELVLALADQSLLRADRGRFEMMETIRVYAHQHLVDADEVQETRRAHACLFAELAGDLDGRLFGESQVAQLARLDEEHDNLRAALGWSLEHDPELGAHIAASLGQFWFIRGHTSEGRRWITETLRGQMDDTLRARLLVALSSLAWSQSDLVEAGESADKAHKLAESLGDDFLLGVSLDMRARVALFRNEYHLCRQLLESAMEHFEHLDGTRWLADSVHFLGLVERQEGRIEEASALHRRAKELFLEAGDEHGAGWATGAEAIDHHMLGNAEVANELLRSSNEIFARLGDRRGVASGKALQATLMTYAAGGRSSFNEEAIELYLQSLPALIDLVDLRDLIHALRGAVLLLIHLDHEITAAMIWGALLRGEERYGSPATELVPRALVEKALADSLGDEWKEWCDRGDDLDITDAAEMALEGLDDRS